MHQFSYHSLLENVIFLLVSRLIRVRVMISKNLIYKYIIYKTWYFWNIYAHIKNFKNYYIKTWYFLNIQAHYLENLSANIIITNYIDQIDTIFPFPSKGISVILSPLPLRFPTETEVSSLSQIYTHYLPSPDLHKGS